MPINLDASYYWATDVSCARCKDVFGRHKRLMAHKFLNPVDDPDGEFTHWARCPVTGDPVLIRMEG